MNEWNNLIIVNRKRTYWATEVPFLIKLSHITSLIPFYIVKSQSCQWTFIEGESFLLSRKKDIQTTYPVAIATQVKMLGVVGSSLRKTSNAMKLTFPAMASRFTRALLVTDITFINFRSLTRKRLRRFKIYIRTYKYSQFDSRKFDFWYKISKTSFSNN